MHKYTYVYVVIVQKKSGQLVTCVFQDSAEAEADAQSWRNDSSVANAFVTLTVLHKKQRKAA